MTKTIKKVSKFSEIIKIVHAVKTSIKMKLKKREYLGN